VKISSQFRELRFIGKGYVSEGAELYIDEAIRILLRLKPKIPFWGNYEAT